MKPGICTKMWYQDIWSSADVFSHSFLRVFCASKHEEAGFYGVLTWDQITNIKSCVFLKRFSNLRYKIGLIVSWSIYFVIDWFSIMLGFTGFMLQNDCLLAYLEIFHFKMRIYTANPKIWAPQRKLLYTSSPGSALITYEYSELLLW